MRTISKDGIENTFKEVTTITTIRKDKLVLMTKKFGTDFKKALVFDRIKEEPGQTLRETLRLRFK